MTQAFHILLRDKRQQRNMARPFDRLGQAPLVLGTGSRLASRPYPAKFIHVALQVILILVINIINMIYTESADTPAITRTPSTSSWAI
jgi:hypothetical protein